MLKKNFSPMIAGIALLALGAGSPAWATDGAALFKKSCLACHGADANTPIQPIYPRLAGQNEEYLINQLRDIKSGARKGGMSMLMMGIMAPITDEQIVALAKWITAQ
ncbi:MAG TPA: cytochrome c [Sedimenticola sp.]|nr:cytochrome c [Sedimenticola sp.]